MLLAMVYSVLLLDTSSFTCLISIIMAALVLFNASSSIYFCRKSRVVSRDATIRSMYVLDPFNNKGYNP